MKRSVILLASLLCSGVMLLGMTGCGGSNGGQTTASGTGNLFGLPGTSSVASTPTPTPSAVTPTPTPSTVTPTPTPSTVTPTPTPAGNEVTGTWNMNLDLSSLDEETAKQYQQYFAGITMTLTLNADGSYTTVSSNASTGENQNTTGTWTMAGNTVTMTSSNGETENYTYANGRLTGVESYILYFTKGGAVTQTSTPTPTPTPTPASNEVVGTWHMNLDLSGMDEETAQQYRQYFAGVTMTLTLNADGSYAVVSSNASTGENQNTSGTWTMAGNTVTMTSSNGETENYTYANGRLTGVESYIIYFTR